MIKFSSFDASHLQVILKLKVKVILFLDLSLLKLLYFCCSRCSIPAPRLPSLGYFSVLIGDAIAIAIVGFAVSISMAKIFAKKHKYEIDANQVGINLMYGTVLEFLNLCLICVPQLFPYFNYKYTSFLLH